MHKILKNKAPSFFNKKIVFVLIAGDTDCKNTILFQDRKCFIVTAGKILGLAEKFMI